MKPQLTKKSFAFIIIMMFSISFLNAQCPTCHGNQVAMYKYKRCGSDLGLCPIFTCVHSKDVNAYLAAGWIFCPGYTQSSNKITNKGKSTKPSVIIPAKN